MLNLWTEFQMRFSDWRIGLLEHIQLSLMALLLAIVSALVLGIILAEQKRLKEWVLQFVGVVQTIPSLALLGLFIPLLGIGKLPAITALVIYAVFPILQNTIVGLTSIDPALEEAAQAFGMNRWERLCKFELPLAMPTIMSGVRTSAVLVIGTATLGALIGAGGLGTFILLGIDRNNPSLILIGAISAALLAILVNSGIKYLEGQSIKRLILALLAAFIGLGMSFVSWQPMASSDKQITIAGKLGVEPDILIHLYKEMIETNSMLKVQLEPNFGKTSFLYEALKNKQIDIYPEFTGTILANLLTTLVGESDPAKAYEAAKTAIAQQDQLSYLQPMAYQNTYTLAVKRAVAEKYRLSKISDLARVSDQITAGFTLEFADREDGYKGLQQRYGLNLSVKTLEPTLRYQALVQDNVQVIDAYSTDSELIEYDLVTLEDDLHVFPPYQAAPLMRHDFLAQYPEIEPILNQLAGKISSEEMSRMNYQVKVEGKSAAEVAHQYLISQNLVTP